MKKIDEKLQMLSDDAIEVLEKIHPIIIDSTKGIHPEEDLILNFALARLIVGTALVTHFDEKRDMDEVNSMVSQFSGHLIRWADEVLPLSFKLSEQNSSFKEMFNSTLH